MNWSRALVHYPKACSPTLIHSPLEMAFQQAHGAGIISVVGAGNDGCNAGDFSPTRIDEVFTVGATSANRLNVGQDEIWPSSRTGIAVSTFAPGSDVSMLSITGTQIIASGTSLSTPIVAGLIATACAAAAPYCEQNSVPILFSNFRNLGLIGSVVGTGGAPLPNGTVSRFIGKSW